MLIALCFFYLAFLAADIPGVFQLYLHAVAQKGRHIAPLARHGGHVRIVQGRAAQKVCRRGAALQRRLALFLQHGVCLRRAHHRLLQPGKLGLLCGLAGAEIRPARVVHKADGAAKRGKALVGIILPQVKPVFRTAGHHAVGVQHALCHKVVHQRADIAFLPGQHHPFFPAHGARRIDARQQALCGGLLIAGGAVELPCAVQPLHRLCLQRGAKGRRVHTVVFNGVGRAHELQMLKALYGAVHGVLHVFGQAGGHALKVHLLCVLAARLYKYLMARLFRKAHHLVFNRGAVARPDALNGAAVQRRAVQVCADNVMGGFVCKGDIAIHPVFHLALCQKGKRLDGIVALLAHKL